MTAFSLRIRAFPDGVSREQLEAPTLSAAVVRNLQSWARDCGPYRLQSWAEPRGAALYFVDNCWVRAAVTGAQVKEFAAEMLQGLDLRDVVTDGGRYLIEAEEY